jgi:serine/threonine protein kinase
MDHPNIIKVSDIFDEAEEQLMVMEYCEGGSLSKREDPLTEK